MLEILSPAGTPEGVIAAVQNGADAIYLSFGSCDAHRGFTRDEFGRALEYCRVRSVKTYLELPMTAADGELPLIAEHAKDACRLGVDAIIVRDLGVMMAVRQTVPEVSVHAGEQMSIHSLEGVRIAAAMGLRRVALSRELSRRKIAHICHNAPIETEVFVHGALCMSYSGQCYMNSVVGEKSAGHGLCSQPCRQNFTTGKHAAEYLLSLKDYCLVRYLRDLETIGVTSVRIEGRARCPEYAAIVTGVYSKAARTGRTPSPEEFRALQSAFARTGFTDGYYTNQKGAGMLGAPGEESRSDSVILTAARKNYMNGEFQRVPVRFVGKISDGKRIKLAAMDDRRNTAVVYGPVPDPAFHRELTVPALQTQLHKTGGTPFYCAGVKGFVEPGLSLSVPKFAQLRRELLSEILEQRKALPPPRIEGDFVPVGHFPGHDGSPFLTVSVTKRSQLSKEMEELRPHIIYIPIAEFDDESPALRGFLENDDVTVAVTLPRIMHDSERRQVSYALARAKELGVTDALVGNLGQVHFARTHGIKNLRGDFSLNVYSAQTLLALSNLGFKSAVLPFDMRLTDIRSLPKPVDTELIVYGRLPLMITETCIIKTSTGVCACDNFSGLKGRLGASFPVVQDFGHRNLLLSPKKLFMADRQNHISALGLWAQRLSFTTENAPECVAVMKRYLGLGDYSPAGFTRGLYYFPAATRQNNRGRE